MTSETYIGSARRNQIRSLLLNAIQDYATPAGLRLELTDDTRLLGPGAPLDSLGLVTVLAGFEAEISDVFRTDILLADERAMSLERSPFRTISSLIDYTCMLLEEAEAKRSGS